jgi:hypothetical protein
LIASCCRKAVVELIKDPETQEADRDDSKQVKSYLGVEIFEDTEKEKVPQIGVVTGLAYTDFGGDILPMEVTYFPGKGGLVLTGKLGDVMKESATIAVDYVRANARSTAFRTSCLRRTTSTSISLKARSPKTVLRPASPSRRRSSLASPHLRRQQRGDDGRGDLARQSPSDRRIKGEIPGRPPQRHQDHHRPQERTPKT